ncbi:HAMP domain-containing protein [Nocardia sp. ET3-3]|uniref:histidine kinase n=1 Tax=Nocardia terrae TaxID=2675851 RepID=A0A7K1V8C5_9NOCA|nr:nitrate- and nitrite sensing domain-containing protein [Nocardia terrae]MVU82732.1 HAMP domain-containing protein [Nocardia terrae]
MRFPKLGVRTRILAIALVPSLALVIIGVSAAGTLVDQSHRARGWADEMQGGIAPTRELIEAVQAERQLTLWRVAGMDIDVRQLTTARQRLDNALRVLVPTQSKLTQMGPESMGQATDAISEMGKRLAGLRSEVDTGSVASADAYSFYNRIPQSVMAGVEVAEKTAPDAATTFELTQAADVLRSLEAMSRAYALGASLIDGDNLSPALGAEYLSLVGYYRTRIDGIVTAPDEKQAAAAKALVSTPAWQRLGVLEPVLAQRTLTDADSSAKRPSVQQLPISIAEWQRSADEVTHGLADLWQAENTEAQHLAADAASDTTRQTLWAGAGMVVVALIAILVALALANRIIGRLRRLRDRTFALADEELPETMRRLAAGEHLEVETPALDFGRDEIGQVAEAFGHAHATAVAAAVTEARTREGVKSVFLNIAHRSQVVVHRQLEILDAAESQQEDPALLDIYFRLDHLATRERRNAENLIILAGGRPGRQWRNPVPLLELVRSAVGETADYTRVQTARLPQAFIAGTAVADLIHLLAELVDNAAHFSPPQSRVEITGSSVGRGAAVEISDQGVGITPDHLDRLNALLSAPPDFAVTSLSEDSRLGLFVVSRLAARHNVSVRLSDSDYGGIRAIVLIPSSIIVGEIAAADTRTANHPPQRSAELEQSASQSPLTREIAAHLGPHTPRHPPLPAEQARDLFSAIENGTRQGRRADPGVASSNPQEGDGEHLPRW